jgi:hypothetical protein
MNHLEFVHLCRDASSKLGLQDTAALGLGCGVSLDDVLFEAAYLDGHDSFVLLADLGAIGPGEREDVYENLLSMQLTARGGPPLRFGLHPMREAAVLCMDAAPGGTTDAARLAALMKAMATQVAHCRQTCGLGHQT